MKRFIGLLAFVLGLTVAGSGFAQDQVFNTPGQHSIGARITGMDCRRDYPVFQIAGMPARQFVVDTLQAGNSCTSNRPLQYLGFSIWSPDTNGQKVYGYSRSEKGTVSEQGGSLNNLVLNPGTYQLVVDGGNGAVVSLQFTQ